MLFDIRLQALAAISNTDFLTVIKHMPMPGAEAAGAILTLSQQRFAASPQTASVVAAGGLVILANFHASRPAPTAAPPPKQRRRTDVRLTRRRIASSGLAQQGDRLGRRYGLEAELAVGRLAAALAALFDGLLTLKLEDRNDAALVDVPARQAARIDAVGV